MLANNFKKSLLAINVGVILSAGVSGVAVANTNSGTQAEENVEVIEVRGIRRSLEASVNTKRFANAAVDSVSAEDIGEFPDNNLAESLGRVPGVTVSRQFGEGSSVSIRGASNQLTKTSLNGQNVASTGWYTEQSIDRSFNYSLLAPELISSMDVYKSSQADIVEGGVGGTVVVKTRRPLDLDANTFFGSVKATQSSVSDETDPSISGLYSWKNEDETFGVLAAIAKSEYTLERRGYEGLPSWGGRVGLTNFQQERNRTAKDLQLQYSPNDALDFGFHYMELNLEADNLNQSMWIPQDTSSCSTNPQGVPVLCTTSADSGLQNFYDVRTRLAEMNTELFAFDMSYEGENVKIEFQLGTTEATGGTNFEAQYFTFLDQKYTAGTIDATGERMKLDLANRSVDAVGPLSLSYGEIGRSPNIDEEDYTQIDFTFPLDGDFITSVKTGLRWVHHEVKKEGYQPGRFDPVPQTGLTSGTVTYGENEFTAPGANMDAMVDYAQGFIGDNWVYQRAGYAHVVEENFASYVMANFSGEGIRGNFGLRYISSDVSSESYQVDLNFVDTVTDGINNGYTTQLLQEDHSYNEVLPSVNIAFDVEQDVILRMSAATVIARPNYQELFNNSSQLGYADNDPTNQTVALGTAFLSPFKANQADIGIEWYYSPTSLIAFSYFTKQVETFTTFETIYDQQTGVVDPDSGEDSWDITSFKDGKGGDIRGVEFQWQHTFDNGFGGVFNYTYADASADPSNYTDGNDVFSDSSEHTVNAVGFYEDEVMSARVAYTWRSDYMIREVGFYSNREHQDFGTLDLSFSYKVNENITIIADATNILEEESVQIGRDQGVAAVDQRTSYGYPSYSYEGESRYSLGVQYRF